MSLNSISKWFTGRGRRTSARRVQTTRLQLESLERREVPARFGAPAISVPTPAAAHMVADKVAPTSPASPASAVAHPAVAVGYRYTAITIRNNTRGMLNYSFRWGNGAWVNYSLSPGQSRVHYISALNQTATIGYDRSFAPGVQLQQYTLRGNNVTFPAGFYLVQPTPSIGSGRLYTFGSVVNGVQLFS